MNTKWVANLAEQYWVECDTGNRGCAGGNTRLALEFVQNFTGLYYEGELPYLANATTTCTVSPPTRNLGFPKLKTGSPALRVNASPYYIKYALT